MKEEQSQGSWLVDDRQGKPISSFVTKAEARSIVLTHPQTEIIKRQNDLRGLERRNSPTPVAANLKNLSIYWVYISHSV